MILTAPRPNESTQKGEAAPLQMNVGRASVLVPATAAECYERWMRFEDLPQFIPALHDVQRIDETHFSIATSGDGREERSVIDVLLRIPERRIAWRSVSSNLGLGMVSFEPRTATTTEVTLQLRSIFDPAVSAQRAREYLRNFKRIVQQQGQAAA